MSPAESQKQHDICVSVVVNTDGRSRSLEQTLLALRHVEYPNFEVCVVRGPTEDGITELLDNWAGRVRVAFCPERNLSRSRNIGIAMADGEVVAFIDDDAIPEPDWLNGLVAYYDQSGVGAVGGFVYDCTGVSFQTRFVTANRLGRADQSWARPAPEFCFPFSANFPHLQGTNSSFRRSALLAVGGFDEEYDYYLDETDLCCRLIDAGWKIVQVTGAAVHHKALPSYTRTNQRVVRSWYSLFKNKIYYSLANGRHHYAVCQIIDDARSFIEWFRQDMERAITEGLLDESDRQRFVEETDRAVSDGLARGMDVRRKLLTSHSTIRSIASFQPFPVLAPSGGRRRFAFLCREYPRDVVGNVGRYIRDMARAIAALGHEVHVLTAGADRDRVDFEDGIWIHRPVLRPATEPPLGGDIRVPQHIWNYSTTMVEELHRIAERRPIDCVYASMRNCEALAVLLDGHFPLVTGLQTTLHFRLQTQPHLRANPDFMEETPSSLLALEARLLRESAGIHAISAATVQDITAAYHVDFLGPVAVIPIGLDDWRQDTPSPPEDDADESLRILFVGRLEARKGIDVLLHAAKSLLQRYSYLRLDIVGNDRLPGPDGKSYRLTFETDSQSAEIRNRVVFHGEVPDETLRRLYAACDIFVAPSRCGSSGLIFLEAMMMSRPVVGCRTGGIPEIIEEGVTGLLAEAGDADSLEAKLSDLITDSPLRKRMGASGRRRYERYFTAQRMAVEITRFMCEVGAQSRGDIPCPS
jgi:glycogen synthase